MKDANLQRKIRLIELYLNNWKKLHSMIAYGFSREKPVISVQQERDFTEVRSDLLQEHEVIYQQLQLSREYAGKTMGVLNRAVSMNCVRNLPVDEIRRIETEWNFVFTKLELLLGQLKLKKRELASTSWFHILLPKAAKQQAALLCASSTVAVLVTNQSV